MRATPEASSSIQKLIDEPNDLADIMDILAEMEQSSDRAAAVILGTQVEDALTSAILSRLIKLPQKQEAQLLRGPIRSFAAKIEIGFALGLYGPDTRDDLDAIRHVRNAFAHARKPIRFATRQVASKCGNLRAPKRVLAADAPETPWPPSKPREQFFAASQILWRNLNRCAVKFGSRPPEPCPLLRD